MRPLNKKGFTLIELITTISIIAIIATVTSAIFISLIQLIIYVPREAKTRTVAQELMDIMIEGDSSYRGMRYAFKGVDASPTQFTYTFGYPSSADRRNVRFRWGTIGSSAIKKVYRSYTGYGTLTSEPAPPYSNEEVVPYYAAADDISISENPTTPNAIFKYFKKDGSEWTSGDVTQIGRVEITIVVKSGTGLFKDWQSSFQTTSSVDIRQ